MDVTGAATDLGWAEEEEELAMRLSLTLANVDFEGAPLSSLARPGCYLAVTAEWGADARAVARGKIDEWRPDLSPGGDTVALVAYDELYDLQKSQDNRYISAGTGTRSAVTAVFSDWGVPVGRYEGPDLPQPKTVLKNKTLADIVLELLETARRKGGKRCVVRATEGKVEILPEGSNQEVWHFAEDLVTGAGYAVSGGELVTRVKIVGTSDKSGRQPVEAVLNGAVEYGIRQRIYNRTKNTSLADAKAAAQLILDEEGRPAETISLSGPDIPTLRRGDRISVKTRLLDGDYIVKAVQHDAAAAAMSLSLRKEGGG